MNEKNILLLALSEFNTNIKSDNYYYIEDDGYKEVVASKYQLEPGTKYILSELAKSDRKIDKIFMLCTKETGDKVKEFDGFKDISAKEYYVKKIREFINDSSVEVSLEQMDDNAVQKFEAGKTRWMEVADDKKHLYTKEHISQLFNEIDIIEGQEYGAISKIVMAILPMKDEHTKVNIFVDMQGGKRNTIFTLNAVLNMLKNNDINVEKSIAIGYQRGNTVHNIIDETKSSNIFDLVSGMDEFFSYGKGKKFCEYYDKIHDGESENIAENRIVNLIRSVSDAIELCNVVGMEQGIGQLAEEIRNYMEMDDEKKDPLFESLVPMLNNEYKNLLKDEATEDGNVIVDRVAVIEWCVNKGLYQQALTLVEAKIPEEMIKDNILYYCIEGDEEGCKKAEEFFEERRYDLPPRQKYLIKDISHYFIKDMFVNNNSVNRKYKEVIFDIKSIDGLSVYTNVAKTEELKEKLAELLSQYAILSDKRNDSNHANEASDDNVNERIKSESEKFIKLYKEIRGNVSGNNKSHMIVLGKLDTKKQAEYNKRKEELKKKRVEAGRAEETVREYIDRMLTYFRDEKIKTFLFDGLNGELRADFERLYDEMVAMSCFSVDDKTSMEIDAFYEKNKLINELLVKDIKNKSGTLSDRKVGYLQPNNKGNAAHITLMNQCKTHTKELLEVFEKLRKESDRSEG